MLEIDRLSVRFDGLEALRDLTLAFSPGARIGVLGPNGSGKTTLFNAISGLVGISAGAIRLGDQEISRLAPHHIAAAGVARTFQTPRLFQRMSVLENVLPRVGAGAMTAAEARRTALTALEAADLAAHRDVLAGELGAFEQRRLEIARALAARPRLLLADDPTAGLSHAEADQLMQLIDCNFDRSTTILLIEHRINAIESLCARSVLLVEGQLRANAPTAEMVCDRDLAAVYFGQQLSH